MDVTSPVGDFYRLIPQPAFQVVWASPYMLRCLLPSHFLVSPPYERSSRPVLDLSTSFASFRPSPYCLACLVSQRQECLPSVLQLPSISLSHSGHLSLMCSRNRPFCTWNGTTQSLWRLIHLQGRQLWPNMPLPLPRST